MSDYLPILKLKRATLRSTITSCVNVQSCNGRNHAELFDTLR